MLGSMRSESETPALIRLVEIIATGAITRSSLGEAIGVSQPTVSGWVSGISRPKAEHRAALSRCIGIPETDWLTDAEVEHLCALAPIDFLGALP